MICPYCGPDCNVGYGMCHCGCGLEPKLNRNTQYRFQFCSGHTLNIALDKPAEIGYCACGCGQRTRFDRYTKKYSQYLRGHNIPRALPINDTQCALCGDNCVIGIGYCHCGCGQPTNRSQHRLVVNGKVYPKGTYCVFRHGHQNRIRKTTNAEMARMIRRQYLTVHCSMTSLATEYNVSIATISKILNMKSHINAGIATEEEFARYGERINNSESVITEVN